MTLQTVEIKLNDKLATHLHTQFHRVESVREVKVELECSERKADGLDQASAVGCKGVVKAPWSIFLLDSTIPGGLMMV